MKTISKFIHYLLFVIIFLGNGSLLQANNSEDNFVTLTIHLRGVYDSKITLMSLSVSRTSKTINEIPGIKNGQTTKITVSKDYLPGEFVLRFDYREKESSTPYPSEKYFFISKQDLELWVSPMYCNNSDSTRFQKGERENAAFVEFSKENMKKKEKLGVLQNFLMNYDDTESKLYKEGIKEYETRRMAYNEWLAKREKQDDSLFISNMYCFQYVPEIVWKGNETDRINNLIAHYFDGMDFKDPLLIKTSSLNKWMDSYVNLYGQLAATVTLRDSLFPLAGKTAIEKALQGDPLVYGWMVDYFYKGFESNAIDAGMKALEPYLNDPNCLTSKRKEIGRRLKGMETLVPGSKAPDISLKENEKAVFDLYAFTAPCKTILVLFWSANCSHCVELADKLHQWQQQPDIRQKMEIIAVSLDEIEAEVKIWEQKLPALSGWKHLRAAEGINSKVANDYFVLATPVMILMDAKTKEIISLPNTLSEIQASVK